MFELTSLFPELIMKLKATHIVFFLESILTSESIVKEFLKIHRLHNILYDKVTSYRVLKLKTVF